MCRTLLKPCVVYIQPYLEYRLDAKNNLTVRRDQTFVGIIKLKEAFNRIKRLNQSEVTAAGRYDSIDLFIRINSLYTVYNVANRIWKRKFIINASNFVVT